MKLLLDHHYSPAIAEQLRARVHDVQTALERGRDVDDDEHLLELCVGEQRALLTNNVADFSVIARRWALGDRRHLGLVFTSDRSLPRHRGTIGIYVSRLDALLHANHADSALADQVCWLLAEPRLGERERQP